MNRIQVVDLARAFSILAVLAHHFNHIAQPSPYYPLSFTWYKIWINGGMGVEVFFVVSGFVITRLIASQPGGLFQPDFRDFYARRAGRILPLLTVTCFLGIIMILFFSNTTHPFEYCFKPAHSTFTIGFWLSILTFTFYWYRIFLNIPTTYFGLHWDLLWSLSIEENFYFFYPLLLKKLGNTKNLLRFLMVLIFYPPIFNTYYYFYRFPAKTIPFFGNLESFGCLAIGCYLYLASERFKSVLSQNPKASWGLVSLGSILAGWAYFHQDYKVDTWGHIFGFFFLSWGVFLIILGGLNLEVFNSKRLSFLAWPGILSYGGYLIHLMVLYFLWPFLTGKNEFLAFFIFSTVTFIIAGLSYHFFELPMNLWFRKALGRPSTLRKAGTS